MNKHIFSDNITYVEYARSGVEYYTDNLEEMVDLTEKGWKANQYSKGFRIVPPEECIVDITDYRKAIQYENLVFNLAYYNFLKDLLENNKLKNFIDVILNRESVYYRDFEYLISFGPILDTEVRILGSDKRIKRLKYDMAYEFSNNMKYKNYIYEIEEQIKKPKKLVRYNCKLESKTKAEQNFFRELEKNISTIKDINCYNSEIFKIYNKEKIEEINPDVILFIPFGCFKYLSSFITKQDLKKIMFWEIHAEKTKERTFTLFNKDLKDKKVLIIDNMYSGKTIKIAKKKVEERGGKAIILGLNPRNKNNIEKSDYIMILNTIFKKDEVDINDPNLFQNMYVKILKEE